MSHSSEVTGLNAACGVGDDREQRREKREERREEIKNSARLRRPSTMVDDDLVTS